jgi:hypothetical protein
MRPEDQIDRWKERETANPARLNPSQADGMMDVTEMRTRTFVLDWTTERWSAFVKKNLDMNPHVEGTSTMTLLFVAGSIELTIAGEKNTPDVLPIIHDTTNDIAMMLIVAETRDREKYVVVHSNYAVVLLRTRSLVVNLENPCTVYARASISSLSVEG